MRKLVLVIALVMLASCRSQGPRLPEILSPYRIDIQQGNVVTQDMVAKLKAGLTRSQVRFILGSPLVVDMFHADRWDYIYLLQRQGRPDERRRLTVIFDGDKLVTIEGDVVLADRDLEPAARHPETAPAPKPEAAKPVAKPEPVKPAPKPEPVKPAPAPEPVKPAPKPEPVKPVAKPATVPDAAPAPKPVAAPVVNPPSTEPSGGPADKAPSAASGSAPQKTDAGKSDAAKPDVKKDGADNSSGSQRMLDKIGF